MQERVLGGLIIGGIAICGVVWAIVEGSIASSTAKKSEKELESTLYSVVDGKFEEDKKGLNMTAKPFAVGVRIEHPQEMINISQYGEKYAKKLPPASYKLTYTTKTNRGVYSFCMCPGGYVVNASSEEKMLAAA